MFDMGSYYHCTPTVHDKVMYAGLFIPNTIRQQTTGLAWMAKIFGTLY